MSYWNSFGYRRQLTTKANEAGKMELVISYNLLELMGVTETTTILWALNEDGSARLTPIKNEPSTPK